MHQRSRRHVLIVGINYWPEETGIAPYTTDLAEHLAEEGWKVTVLTGMPHYPQWRLRPQYHHSLRRAELRDAVEIRRFRHYVPRRQSALRRGLYEGTFLCHAMTATRLGHPDCVVGVVPSLSGALVAAFHARLHGIPLGLIVQDLMSPAASQSGLPGAALVARPVRTIESRVARWADRVAVITDSFRPYLEDIGVAAGRIVHVPNWAHVPKPAPDSREMRRALAWPEGTGIVLHAGNIGYKQGLENVVEAARLAAEQNRPLRFVLMGDGADRPRLESLGKGLSTLEFLDPQPNDVFMDVLAAADVLLLNERASVREMSLPGKITSYFTAERPVVAAVSPIGSTAVEVGRSGGALVIPPEDPFTLVEAVARVVTDGGLQARLISAGSAYAAQHFERSTLLRRAERFVTELAEVGSDRPAVAARHG